MRRERRLQLVRVEVVPANDVKWWWSWRHGPFLLGTLGHGCARPGTLSERVAEVTAPTHAQQVAVVACVASFDSSNG